MVGTGLSRTIVCLNVPMSVTDGWKASWVIPDVYTVLRGCRLYPGSPLDHSYNVVVFMAAQPSKDGRLGGSPQNSYAGRHPSKRFVQGERRIPSVSNSPEGRRADGEQSTI